MSGFWKRYPEPEPEWPKRPPPKFPWRTALFLMAIWALAVVVKPSLERVVPSPPPVDAPTANVPPRPQTEEEYWEGVDVDTGAVIAEADAIRANAEEEAARIGVPSENATLPGRQIGVRQR